MILMSEKVDLLALALSKAQGEIKNPEKNKTATIPTKAGGVYSYNYADLAITVDVIRAALAKYEIMHSSQVDPDTGVLSVILIHSSGQWIMSALVLPQSTDPKIIAANMTYFKRYLLTGLVGVAADDDLETQPEAPSAGYADRKRAQQPKEQAQPPEVPTDPSEVVIAFGKHKGRPLKSFSNDELNEFTTYWQKRSENEKRPLSGAIKTAVDAAIILIAKKEFTPETPPLNPTT